MVKLYSISSGIQKVLGFQAALKSTARFPNFRAMSSASTTHPDINRITSYCSDAMALNVASTAVAKGFDWNVTNLQQPIFYLPFLHDENLVSQVAAASLNDGLLSRCAPGSRDAEYAETSRASSGAMVTVFCDLEDSRLAMRCWEGNRRQKRSEYLKEHSSGF
ncbi:hypothetical protein LHYA1_G006229 [Lachnellula hyalina]|uniref:Uncharacterized protein n=1 Tax=Lachnellula hyalina TaxID=1316788 RepID=A0A8H8TXJ1_9HELO|nr:uncharacterized protein LHYA1_G006229 [Lachnellula hyalina]TVY25572.1 hypothetical protein LHYA1_G006229 [Lachnellula hyalina]